MDITGVFIVTVIIFCLGFDLWAYVTGRKTISQVIYKTAYTPPGGALVPFLLGVLMGHLFFNQ